MTDQVAAPVDPVTPAPVQEPVPVAVDPKPAPAPVQEPAPVVPAPAPQDDVVALKARLAALEAKANRPCVAVRAFNASVCGLFTAGRATACAVRVINGFKTFLFFGVSGSLALASEFDAIDLTPFLSAILPDGVKVSTAQAVTLLSVAGIALRLVTKTPAFKRWAKPSQSAGSVDEPKE